MAIMPLSQWTSSKNTFQSRQKHVFLVYLSNGVFSGFSKKVVQILVLGGTHDKAPVKWKISRQRKRCNRVFYVFAVGGQNRVLHIWNRISNDDFTKKLRPISQSHRDIYRISWKPSKNTISKTMKKHEKSRKNHRKSTKMTTITKKLRPISQSHRDLYRVSWKPLQNPKSTKITKIDQNHQNHQKWRNLQKLKGPIKKYHKRLLVHRVPTPLFRNPKTPFASPKSDLVRPSKDHQKKAIVPGIKMKPCAKYSKTWKIIKNH